VLLYSSALIKEAAISSETWVHFYQATRHHITEEKKTFIVTTLINSNISLLPSVTA